MVPLASLGCRSGGQETELVVSMRLRRVGRIPEEVIFMRLAFAECGGDACSLVSNNDQSMKERHVSDEAKTSY